MGVNRCAQQMKNTIVLSLLAYATVSPATLAATTTPREYCITPSGDLVFQIPRSASLVSETKFESGYATVVTEGKLRYLNRKGQLIKKKLRKAPPLSSEGLTAAEMNGKVGFTDQEGIWAVKPQYDFVTGYSSGLSLVWQKDLKLSFIDQTGKDKIILNPIHNKAIYVRHNLDFGRPDLPEKFSLSAFDKNSKYVHPLISPSVFREGLAPMTVDSKVGFINTSGEFVIPPKYQFAFPFEEGRALVVENGKYGFIDRTGKVVIAPVFKNAHSFSNGLAAVQLISGKWGYINKDGKVAIDPKFSYALPFSEGLAFVRVDSEERRNMPTADFQEIEQVPDLFELTPEIRLGRPKVVPKEK